MTLRNLMITMLLGGLWHGASWHFVVWGAFHGALLIIYRLIEDRRRAAQRPTCEPGRGACFWLSVLIFFHLVCFGWLLFRATDMAHVGRLLAAAGRGAFWEPACGPMLLMVAAAGLPLAAFQVYQYRRRCAEPWVAWPGWLRAGFYVALFYGIVLFGAPGSNEFIYFQF
jgi:hypothetical protein